MQSLSRKTSGEPRKGSRTRCQKKEEEEKSGVAQQDQQQVAVGQNLQACQDAQRMQIRTVQKTAPLALKINVNERNFSHRPGLTLLYQSIKSINSRDSTGRSRAAKFLVPQSWLRNASILVVL